MNILFKISLVIHQLFAVSVLSLLLISCSDKNTPKKLVLKGKTMGTSYHITLIAPETILQKHSYLQNEIDSTLKDINSKMSTYQSGSEISLFNSNPSKNWIPVSGDFLDVVKNALLISSYSLGYFDITTSPLVEIWGFGSKLKINPPKQDEIKLSLTQTGYQKLKIQENPPALKKTTPKLQLDLSSIAKGYAVDKVSNFLTSNSIPDHLVEIGGEIKVSGKNLSGKKWRIAIENPGLNTTTFNSFIELENTGVATSGDYRNFYIENNKKRSHIINPKTGYPIINKLASVTVINKSTMLADGWATALMALGEEHGKKTVLEHDLSVHMIIRNNEGKFSTWKHKMP